MALPQDGQNANGLTKVTEIPKGKELIFIDPTTNEGGIITLEDLTTQILKNLTSQTFALDQGNMTLLAALNQLNSNSNFAELKFNSDLNSAIEMRFYHTTQSNVANSLKNKPSSIQSGEMIIAWLPSSQDNLYGCQLLFLTESTSQNAYMRHKIVNQWTAWQKFSLS